MFCTAVGVGIMVLWGNILGWGWGRVRVGWVGGGGLGWLGRCAGGWVWKNLRG